MSAIIRKIDDRCQRLEVHGQKVLTAIETANVQTAGILKALSGAGGGGGKDTVSAATDDPAVNKKAVELLISASRAADEQKASEIFKNILDLFPASTVGVAISCQDMRDYSAVMSAIASACWSFVAPHAAGVQRDLQHLESLACQTSILGSLRYDDMRRREDDITEAFGDTYTWAFDTSASLLSSWLQAGSGTFWINGKPGSGKLTLMKAIATTRFGQTAALLQTWSGPKTLVVLKHFFWGTGTALQSSYKGLLEGLVYQAFRQDLHIIPKACPSRWAEADASVDSG